MVWLPVTVRLPLITKLLPVILPVVVKLLSEKSIPLAADVVILPLAIVTLPISALVATDKVPAEVMASATIPLLASYITALLATAVPAVAPDNTLISSLVAVTPVNILSSASVDVTVASLFICAALAVTAVPSNVKLPVANVVVVVSPLIVTDSLPRVIKSASAPWPILSVPMLTLPISSEPALRLSFPISIAPKVSVIEPAVKAPTSVIPPLSASCLTYLSSDWVLVKTSDLE